MTVCSAHFLESDYVPTRGAHLKQKLKNIAVPSQNLPVRPIRPNGKVVTSPLKRKNERADRARKRMLGVASTSAVTSVTSESDSNEVMSDVSVRDDGDGITEDVASDGEREGGGLSDADQAVFKDIGIQTDSDGSELVQSVLSSDQRLYTCTGLHSRDLLNSLVESFDRIAPPSKFQTFAMKTRDRIILTMMKIKLGLSFAALAAIFNIIFQTCCNYFYDSVVILSKILRRMIFWPNKEDIVKNMPRCFSEFRSTRAVLDCFELNIERPLCLRCRVRSYSFYKKNHTAKILMVCTPSGLISDVVCAFGGRASDKTVTNHSNIYWKCDYGDALMVDKGFDIDDECLNNMVKLYRPPFLRQKKKFSAAESVQGAKIARARVHVERVIERVREYHFMKNRLSWKLVPYIDDLVIIVSGLVNLGPPVLARDKY